MPTPEPRRLDVPRKHLDAHLTTLESALLYRAGRIEDENDEAVQISGRPNLVKAEIASQLRELAEELHYW